jgi:hypothetical protein
MLEQETFIQEQELPQPTGGDSPALPILVKSRLTVVETLYHQPAGGFPATMLGDASRFYRDLSSDEQAYERHRALKGDWEPLDCGWIDRCGMLLVRNDEGQFTVNPTPDQRAEVSRKVIEMSFDGERTSILIPPTETCRFYPADIKQIKLRCHEGVARYTICLLPE